MTFDQFVQEIMAYESDTFSASDCNITKQEAVELAQHCIDFFVSDSLDGCILDCGLSNIRDS